METETEKRIQLRGVVFLICVFLLLGATNAVEEVTSFGETVTSTESGSNSVLDLLSGINPPVIVPATDCPICECGISNENEHRIVGGVEVDPPYKYPWLAAIFHKNNMLCGGALITDRHVVTAAHCTTEFDRVLAAVYLMEHNIASLNDTNIIKTRVKWFYRHPLYNGTNDIAVLLLDTVLTWTDKLRPICMPTPGETYADNEGIVAGWGQIYKDGPGSDVPREVTVPIMSNEDCNITIHHITDDNICIDAYDPDGGKDACEGDSGGPLIVKIGNVLTKAVYQFVGVTSYGVSFCGDPDAPGIYSRVSYNLDWIRSVTTDGCYCSTPILV